MKPVTVLVDNLRFLCHQNPGEWSPSKTATDYSQHSWINPTILKNQKDSYEKTALKTTEKMTDKDLGIEGSRKWIKLVNEKGSGKRVEFLRVDKCQVELVLSHLIGANICHRF